LVDAEKHFRKVLSALKPLFTQHGFRAMSQNFVLESPECWAIINFQKSRWSVSGERVFYINVGVTAKRLMAFRDQPVSKPPAYYSCSWRDRVQHFAPEPKIRQWTVCDESTAAETIEYLQILFADFVIPSVKEMMTESALIERWNPMFPYPGLKDKAVLLAAQGRSAELGETIQQLREGFENGVVGDGLRCHIEKMRDRFPEEMRDIREKSAEDW
jgi:hypothetical protein